MRRFSCLSSETELPDVAEAQSQAIAAAGEWIKDKTRGGAGAALILSVRDGTPTPLFTVTASVRVSRDTD
jgi:hypothetical protein